MSFSLFDYSVSDQIRKEYFLTILFLAAPAPNPNINQVWFWFSFPPRKVKEDTGKEVFIAVWDFWASFKGITLFSLTLSFFFFFPSRMYLCWYHSFIQFWLNYYTLHYFVLFSQINVTKHKVIIFLYGAADLGIFWCCQKI